jgi:hypothetical protein
VAGRDENIHTERERALDDHRALTPRERDTGLQQRKSGRVVGADQCIFSLDVPSRVCVRKGADGWRVQQTAGSTRSPANGPTQLLWRVHVH